MTRSLSPTVLLALCLSFSAHHAGASDALTLPEWSVTGTDPKTLGKLPELTLPASAQLVRFYKSSDVILRISTRPTLGLGDTDYPVLEVGDNALVFARGPNGGTLTLILGDNLPIELPFTYALDTNGQSIEPLSIEFGKQGTQVSLAVDGKVYNFKGSVASSQPSEVVISASTSEPWAFSELALRQDGHTASTLQSKDSGYLGKKGNPGAGSPSESGSVVLLGNINTPKDVTAPGNGSPSVKTALQNISSLEIYTPQAYRHGRVDAIRAMAKQNNIQ